MPPISIDPLKETPSAQRPTGPTGCLAKRKIEITRCGDYVENGWIPDSILLVGEIVE